MLVTELMEARSGIRLVHEPLDRIVTAIRARWCCQLYARDGQGHLPECRNYVSPYVPTIMWESSTCGRREAGVPGDVGKYRRLRRESGSGRRNEFVAALTRTELIGAVLGRHRLLRRHGFSSPQTAHLCLGELQDLDHDRFAYDRFSALLAIHHCEPPGSDPRISPVRRTSSLVSRTSRTSSSLIVKVDSTA